MSALLDAAPGSYLRDRDGAVWARSVGSVVYYPPDRSSAIAYEERLIPELESTFGPFTVVPSWTVGVA